MVQPSFHISTALQAGTAVASLAITRPDTAANLIGKYWIIGVTSTTDKVWTEPSGFLRIGTASARGDFFGRICDGTEAATVTVAYTTGTGNMRGGSAVYKDTDLTTPVSVTGPVAQPAAGTTNVIPQITVPAGSNQLLVSLAQRIGSTATVTPSGGSIAQDFQQNTNASWAGASEAVSPGATGTRTWTWVGTSVTPAILFALNPVLVSAQTEYMGILAI